MKLVKTRTHVFVPAQYEKVEISATVELDSDRDEIDPADIESYANEVLDTALAEDYTRISEASLKDDDETHAHTWRATL